MTKRHNYDVQLIWDGNRGAGTRDYSAYGRQYRMCVAGKPELVGTADPSFRGDAGRHNPEDWFVGAVAACHMLFFLAHCARRGVCVTTYEDDAQGTLALDGEGGGVFEEIVLRPRVRLTDPRHTAVAAELHELAHRQCFIANSCRVPIRLEPTVERGG
jgi:organic hydroperoxide reductase OsmC/OhrA